jgi:hypothetical protein
MFSLFPSKILSLPILPSPRSTSVNPPALPPPPPPVGIEYTICSSITGATYTGSSIGVIIVLIGISISSLINLSIVVDIVVIFGFV